MCRCSQKEKKTVSSSKKLVMSFPLFFFALKHVEGSTKHPLFKEEAFPGGEAYPIWSHGLLLPRPTGRVGPVSHKGDAKQLMMTSPSPPSAPVLQIDPVQKAVLHHTLGLATTTTATAKRKHVSCSVCQLRFNSQVSKKSFKLMMMSLKVRSSERRRRKKMKRQGLFSPTRFILHTKVTDVKRTN